LFCLSISFSILLSPFVTSFAYSLSYHTQVSGAQEVFRMMDDTIAKLQKMDNFPTEEVDILCFAYGLKEVRSHHYPQEHIQVPVKLPPKTKPSWLPFLQSLLVFC